MLYFVKNAGHKYAYDSVSGAFIPLASLEYKMLSALEPPLEKLCPTSLRYELAKYDSDDVSETYSKVYSLFKEGLIFGEGEAIKLCLEGEYAPESFDLAKAALDVCFIDAKSGFDFEITGDSTLKADVITYSQELRKTLNK